MNKLTSMLLVLAMMITSMVLFVTPATAATGVWEGDVASDFAGGAGTENDPYQIANGAQLAYLASLVNEGNAEYNAAHYILTDDIVLNDPAAAKAQFEKFNNASGSMNRWTGIGTSASPFKGTFDGKSNTISGLFIFSGATYNGLFNYTDGATLKDVVFDNAYIVCSATNAVKFSAVVGQASNSTVEGITVRNSAFYSKKSNVKNIGFLAASIVASTVSDCLVDSCTLYYGGTAQHWAFAVGETNSENPSYIKNCTVLNSSLEYLPGTTSGFINVAGILPTTNNNNQVEIIGCNVIGCTLRGSTRVAGILAATGSNAKVRIDNCVFIGTLIADGSEAVTVTLKDGANKDVVNSAGRKYVYRDYKSYTVVGGIVGEYKASSSEAGLTVTNCSAKPSVQVNDHHTGLGDTFLFFARYICVGGLIGRTDVSNTNVHIINNRVDLHVDEITTALDVDTIIEGLNANRNDDSAIATLVGSKTCVGMDGATTVASSQYIKDWVAANTEVSAEIQIALGGLGGELNLTKNSNVFANNAVSGSYPTCEYVQPAALVGRTNSKYSSTLIKAYNNLYAADLGATVACGGTDFDADASVITDINAAIATLNDHTSVAAQTVWTGAGNVVPTYNDWTMTNDSVAIAASVTLGDALTINVYADAQETIAIHPTTLTIDGVAAKGTVEGNKVKYTISEIKASELDHSYRITVTLNGYRLQSFDYSVSKYIQRMTGKDAKLDAVLNALDTYGKAAAGQDVDVDEAYAAVTLTPVANVDNTYVTGIALVLAETVRPIVSVAEGVAQVKVEMYGKDETYNVVDGEVTIDCVTATSLNNVMTLTFLDAAGNELGTTKYAVANYLLSVLGDQAKAEYHDLAKALAVYMEAARIYNNLPIE